MIQNQTDEQRYESGREAATKAINAGYPLNGDGPARCSEAYFNGFIHRLREEREARGKAANA
jgi:hypothetical protein